MRSVLNEILTLRSKKAPVIDYSNKNRYCVIASEDNGTKTAYFFSTPIYNKKSNKLVDLKFYENEKAWRAYGSNAAVSISDKVCLENEDGCFEIIFPENLINTSETSVRYENAEIVPSLNGILVKAACMKHQPYEIRLVSEQSFIPARANERCFSLMKEEFKPFITLSCIGVLNSAGQMIAPCAIEYQKPSDKEYAIILQHGSPYGVTLLFEINLHEEKLFQDTTVESLHPDVNNAFGGTAFIGKTASYGEQWLYSRPDFSKLSNLYDKQIHKAAIHIPKFGGSCALTAFGLPTRFCSFGSKWENKVQTSEEIADTVPSDKYQSLDITKLLTDRAGFLKPSEGFVLKPKVNSCGFSAVSTGDSCFAPQILEINFR